MRAGIDPIEAVGKLGDRLITLQMHDLHAAGSEGHDVPWGTGVGRTEALLREIQRRGIQPKMFGLEYSYDWYDSMPEVEASARFYDQVTLELTE